MSKRWTPARKAEIVEVAVARPAERGRLCDEHDISVEELERWIALYRDGGIDALRQTKLQRYRPGVKITRRGRRRPGSKPTGGKPFTAQRPPG